MKPMNTLDVLAYSVLVSFYIIKKQGIGPYFFLLLGIAHFICMLRCKFDLKFDLTINWI